MLVMEKDRWEGDTAFLSNFAPSAVELDTPGEPFDGFAVGTVEHAYQATKALDPDQRLEILTARTPGAAKRLGRQATLRPDWELIKFEVMRRHVAQKFAMPGFAERLRAVEGEIVEWNDWHDVIWGKCTCAIHAEHGQNLLGQILMEIRDEIRAR